MKSVVICLVVGVVLCAASTPNLGEAPSPLFAWGGKAEFFQGNDRDVNSAVKPWDITGVLKYYLSSSEHAYFPLSLRSVAPVTKARPDVALVVLPSELRSDAVSALADTYAEGSKIGGVLGGLMGHVKAAPSSFVAPSVMQKDSTVRYAVQDFALNDIPRQGGNVIVAHPEGTAPSGFHASQTVPLSKLPEVLAERSSERDGAMDLVLLDLTGASSADRDSMAEADRHIVAATAAVNAATSGSYVAMVVPSQAPAADLDLAEKVGQGARHQQRVMAATFTDNSEVSEGQIYLSATILQALLTLLLLAVIGGCGICCLAQVQTPSMFEDPKLAKKVF